jgi:hypothetical protein
MIVSRRDLKEALGLLDDVVLRPDDLIARLAQFNREIPLEMYLELHLRERGLLNRTRLFPYVMFLVRGDNDSTRWSAGVWNDDVGAHVKYEKEYEAAQTWRGSIANRQDWERLWEDRPDLFAPVG